MSYADSGGNRGMPEEELALVKAQRNLPDHVAEFLRKQPLVDKTTLGIVLIVYIVTLLGFTFLPFIMKTSAFGRFLVNVGVLPADTILLNLNFLSVYPAMFAGPLLGVYLLDRWTRRYPDFYMKTIATELYLIGRRLKSMSLRPAASPKNGTRKDYDPNLSPEHYLKSRERRWVRFCGLGAFVVYMIGLLVFVQDINAGRATPDGIRVSSYFNGQTLNYEWRDVVAIRTGCYTSGGRYQSHHLRYRLEFKDGRTANVGDYEGIGMPFVEALEFVDRKLAALGVDKTRGHARKRCLLAKRKEHGPRGFERLMRLL